VAEAGERFAVQATPAAATAIGALRGRPRKSYDAFLSELRRGGCTVAGYRLLAPDPADYSEYCCKPLAENWRVITTFEPSIAWIIDVVEHDSPQFYRELATKLDISNIGQRREHKPGCCGTAGWPSLGLTRAQRRGTPQ
jgi:hypothetical protein